MRSYYRLILEDSVLTLGDPWPGPDGKPMVDGQGRVISGEICMIGYQSEVIEYDTDESGTQTTKVVRPERYMLLMRAPKSSPTDRDMHGFKNPQSCDQCKGKGCPSCPEETQVYEIPASRVKIAARIQEFGDALEMFHDMLEDMNEDLLDDGDEPEEKSEPDAKSENGQAHPES